MDESTCHARSNINANSTDDQIKEHQVACTCKQAQKGVSIHGNTGSSQYTDMLKPQSQTPLASAESITVT
jgi:hypothetical protein